MTNEVDDNEDYSDLEEESESEVDSMADEDAVTSDEEHLNYRLQYKAFRKCPTKVDDQIDVFITECDPELYLHSIEVPVEVEIPEDNVEDPSKKRAWIEDTKDMEPLGPENINSDDESPDDRSEEDDWVKPPRVGRKRKSDGFISYNPAIPVKDFDFCDGMKFSSREQLKEAVRLYAAYGGYPIWYSVNEKNRIQAKCKQEKVGPRKGKNGVTLTGKRSQLQAGCTWSLWACWMQDQKTFQLKSYDGKHTCTRSLHVKLIKASWLAEKYGMKIRNNPFWRLADFQEDVKREYQVEVSTYQCSKAKKLALSEAEKSLKDHYAQIWRYCQEIGRTNPHSSVYIHTIENEDPTGGRFHRMYMCFSAIRKGWLEGCRPVIGIDGCFLKTYCTGELLTAVGRDGNDQMYPIAWAVVEVENKNSWTWFLEYLIRDIRHIAGNGLTIISDQQKGLIEAVKTVLPLAEHRFCARHIFANWRKRFGGQAYKTKFWEAAKATTKAEWVAAMNDIKVYSEDAWKELASRDPSEWSRAYFETHSKCDSVDNNMCESFNSWIIKARYKPLISMLEDIRRQCMVRLYRNRDLMRKYSGIFGKRIRDKLDKNIADSRFCTCNWNGEKKLEVVDFKYGTVVVDLDARSCGCRRWDLTGIPCAHACSALSWMKQQPDKWVANCYMKDSYLKSYGNMLEPLNGMLLWPQDDRIPIRPPHIRKMPGKPARLRRKDPTEEPKKKKGGWVNNITGEDGGKKSVSKKGYKIRCGYCKQQGHNKRKCPNLKEPSNGNALNAGANAPSGSNGTMRDDRPSIVRNSFVRSGRQFVTSASLQRQVHSLMNRGASSSTQ